MPPPLTNTVKSIQLSTIHQNFNLNLNINFERANSISWLQRIIAIMFERGDVFIGLDLVYSNGERNLYGRRDVDSENLPKTKGVEVSFAIEGARGERISRVEVLHSPADGGNVYAIRVSQTVFRTLHMFRTTGPCFCTTPSFNMRSVLSLDNIH
jgi:hypothetical protein